MNNRERIGKALDSLRQGLYVYAERTMQTKYGNEWITKAAIHLRDHQTSKRPANDIIREDISALLIILIKEWDKTFKYKLNQSDRPLLSELMEVRNQWAHQSTFSTDDTYRAIDSIVRLLKSISAPQLPDVEKQRQDVLRLLSQEQPRYEARHKPVSEAEENRIRQKLDELLERIPFQNACLLNQALTHTSYKYENPNTGEDTG